MSKLSFSSLYDERIRSLLRPHWRRIFLAVVFSLIASGASGVMAWLVKPMIDTIFVEKKYSILAWLPAAVVFTYAFQGFCKMVYAYLMYSTGFRIVRELRNSLFNHLLLLSVADINKESSGRIISRVLADSEQARRLVTDVVLIVFQEIPTIFVLLGVALYRRWDVTLLALIVLPAIVIFTYKQGRSVKKKKKQAQVLSALLSHLVNEAVLGSKVVKIFGNESALLEKFVTTSKAHYRQLVKVLRLKEVTKFFANFCAGIGVALVIWYGGKLVVTGEITSGDFFSALGAVAMLFSPVKQLGKSWNKFQEIRASLDRVAWVENMSLESSGDIPLSHFNKGIQFKNISHRYVEGGELVLTEINLEIRKGEVVAIVGASGAGKTSVLDLIPRFYDPSAGEIVIDGHNIKTLVLADLRKLIGMVSQDVILFNDTIRRNISFGLTDATDEQIVQAAKMAYAHDFISEFENGYDTMLGDRGLNLSGGQRQRIAIARAILKNPPVLILDEATSALDSVSETEVQKAFDILMKEKTTIVVAHRLSTVKHADRIVVMDNGRIISQGTHAELLDKSDMYQELYQSFAKQQTHDTSSP